VNDATGSTHCYGGKKDGKRTILLKLPGMALLVDWATPTTRDHKNGQASEATMNRNSRPLNEQAVNLIAGPASTSSHAATAARGVLNPAHSRWLMGYHKAHERSSPGYASWTLIQRLLSESSPTRDEIESAVCGAMATR
jgi:hypothetical protein